MNRRAHAAEAAPRRFRALVTTAILSLFAVLIGISGAGVTSALLTSSATQSGATITAGTAGIRIGDGSGALGSRALSPATPAVWAFAVSNTGDAPLALAGTLAATGAVPAYAAAALVSLAPVASESACTPAAAGTPAALNGFTAPAMGTLAAGQSSWYCLVVSLPAGTAATGSGTPLSFTLNISATQVAG